jgi:hypothetical protein
MAEPLANIAKDLIVSFVKRKSTPPTEDPAIRMTEIEGRVTLLEEHEQAQGVLVHQLAERVDALTRTVQTLRMLVTLLLVVGAITFSLCLFTLITR